MHSNCCASKTVIQHYWILASVNRLFFPLIFYCIYYAFGPWVYSELADGQYGFVFASAILVDGTFLPGSLTFFYGSLELLLCQFPLNWVYARCVARRYYQVIGMPVNSFRGCLFTFSQILFYFIIIIEIGLSIYNGILYGASAFFLSVSPTWSIVMNMVLYYLARNVPESALE